MDVSALKIMCTLRVVSDGLIALLIRSFGRKLIIEHNKWNLYFDFNNQIVSNP